MIKLLKFCDQSTLYFNVLTVCDFREIRVEFDQCRQDEMKVLFKESKYALANWKKNMFCAANIESAYL